VSRLNAGFVLPLVMVADLALAAEETSRPLNWNAIGMFMVFVLFTLGVTRWAACAHARPVTSTPPAVA